jgi:hypothetical protein
MCAFSNTEEDGDIAHALGCNQLSRPLHSRHDVLQM